MRRFVFVFLLSIFSTLVLAQGNKQIIIDSLQKKLLTDSARIYRFKKIRPYFTFDNRNSFIRRASVNFRGLQLGIIFNEIHTMGIGAYRLTQNSRRPFRTLDNNNLTIDRILNLNYLTIFYEVPIINKRYFGVSLPVEIGSGHASIKIIDEVRGNTIRQNEIDIIPIGAGAQLIIKPWKWIGFSSMGGYRHVQEKNEQLNFNGWYYSFTLWLDIRQVYRNIKYYHVKKRYHRQIKTLTSLTS